MSDRRRRGRILEVNTRITRERLVALHFTVVLKVAARTFYRVGSICRGEKQISSNAYGLGMGRGLWHDEVVPVKAVPD